MTLQNESSVPSRGISQGDNGRNAQRWDLTPEEIKTQTDAVINRINAAYDHIGSLDMEEVSIENTLLPLASAKFNYAGMYNIGQLQHATGHHLLSR